MKAEVDPLHVIVSATIIIVVAVIILAVFRGHIGKGGTAIDDEFNRITANTDTDGDGVFDLFDRCPCTSPSSWDDVAGNGCGVEKDRSEKTEYSKDLNKVKTKCEKKLEDAKKRAEQESSK